MPMPLMLIGESVRVEPNYNCSCALARRVHVLTTSAKLEALPRLENLESYRSEC